MLGMVVEGWVGLGGGGVLVFLHSWRGGLCLWLLVLEGVVFFFGGG